MGSSRDPRRARIGLGWAGGRNLPGVAARLGRERSWAALTALFSALRPGEGSAAEIPLGELATAARRVGEALEAASAGKPATAGEADELRALRLTVADALLARSAHPPALEAERRAFEAAARLLEEAGDHRRAALAYEELADDARAARAWGALGELDRMEAAHAREEQRSSARRAGEALLAKFDALLTGGERRLALGAVARLEDVAEAATVRRQAAAIERRLCRGRAVGLREIPGPWIRCALLPAAVGRDPGAELTLRDPAVSRRHAVLRAGAAGICVEDPGARSGIRLGGARVAPDAVLPLPDAGELGLGPATVLRFRKVGGALAVEGAAGFDRGLRALLGVAPLALEAAFPRAEGLTLELGPGEALRLGRRFDLAVRVDGHFIGPGCDLLHGDVVEVPSAGLRLEVE